MSGLLSVADARARLLASVATLSATETVALQAAPGRVLAGNPLAGCDVPPAANSAMDGYALRHADLENGNRLAVSQRIPAGTAPQPLVPGTAARIFTGAEIPAGADTVVMQEDCREDDGVVAIETTLRPGANIRPAGQDIRSGTPLFGQAGRVLLPADLGLLASVGLGEVAVYRRLRVGLLSTGDELVEPGQALQPGQIYNSNRYLLHGLLAAMGAEVVDYGCVEDTVAATRDVLGRAAADCDCVLSTGGVSVGEEDHVKSVLQELGRVDFWKIAIKPGKPLACGVLDDTPFFGLPGNPVSAFVTFLVIVKPALRKMQGAQGALPQVVPVCADFERSRPATRDEYLRVSVRQEPGRLLATPLPNQSSGVLRSCSQADALLILPAAQTVSNGDSLQALMMHELYAY